MCYEECPSTLKHYIIMCDILLWTTSWRCDCIQYHVYLSFLWYEEYPSTWEHYIIICKIMLWIASWRCDCIQYHVHLSLFWYEEYPSTLEHCIIICKILLWIASWRSDYIHLYTISCTFVVIVIWRIPLHREALYYNLWYFAMNH